MDNSRGSAVDHRRGGRWCADCQPERCRLDSFHALYGFSTIFAVAVLYSYRNSPFIADKVYLLYGCGGLFIMGLGIRNLFLSPISTA